MADDNGNPSYDEIAKFRGVYPPFPVSPDHQDLIDCAVQRRLPLTGSEDDATLMDWLTKQANNEPIDYDAHLSVEVEPIAEDAPEPPAQTKPKTTRKKTAKPKSK